MHAHLLLRPVVWGPHGQVVDILPWAKDRLRTALPTIGENNILGRPRVLIRDEDPLAAHFRCQVEQRGVVDPPGSALSTGLLRVVVNVEELAERLTGQQPLDLLLGAGPRPRSAARFGQGLLPLLQGVEPFV